MKPHGSATRLIFFCVYYSFFLSFSFLCLCVMIGLFDPSRLCCSCALFFPWSFFFLIEFLARFVLVLLKNKYVCIFPYGFYLCLETSKKKKQKEREKSSQIHTQIKRK